MQIHEIIHHDTATRISFISSCIALFIIIAVLIHMKYSPTHRKKKRLENKFFSVICVLGLLMNLYGIFIVFVYPYTTFAGWMRIRKYTPDALYVLYAASWFFFCDYMVFKDKNRLKHRRVGYIALLVGNFLVSFIMSFVRDEVEKGEISEIYMGRNYLQWIYYPVLTIVFLVASWFMVFGFRNAWIYHERRQDPLPLRIDTFFYPWVLGVFAQFVFALEIEGFCAALSILSVYWSFTIIEEYVDWDTGLFNSKFLDYLPYYVKYLKMDIQTAFSLTVPGENHILVDVMSERMHEKCCVIKRDNGDIFVVSDVRRKLAVELMKRNIQDKGMSHNPPVSIVVKNVSRSASESAHDFLIRAYNAF